jgi:hypothetical protein
MIRVEIKESRSVVCSEVVSEVERAPGGLPALVRRQLEGNTQHHSVRGAAHKERRVALPLGDALEVLETVRRAPVVDFHVPNATHGLSNTIAPRVQAGVLGPNPGRCRARRFRCGRFRRRRGPQRRLARQCFGLLRLEALLPRGLRSSRRPISMRNMLSNTAGRGEEAAKQVAKNVPAEFATSPPTYRVIIKASSTSLHPVRGTHKYASFHTVP